MDQTMTRTTNPLDQPRIRIHFVMDLRVWRAAFKTGLALQLPTLYKLMSVRTSIRFDPLFLCQWMRRTEFSHVACVTGVAEF